MEKKGRRMGMGGKQRVNSEMITNFSLAFGWTTDQLIVYSLNVACLPNPPPLPPSFMLITERAYSVRISELLSISYRNAINSWNRNVHWRILLWCWMCCCSCCFALTYFIIGWFWHLLIYVDFHPILRSTFQLFHFR